MRMKDKVMLSVGDPCFAKVKGWIPYPARVVGRSSNVKKVKFSVLFYGTKETGEIGTENLWPVTPQTVKKLVTAKTLQRKYFHEAWLEMGQHHDEAIWMEKEGSEDEGTTREAMDDEIVGESLESENHPIVKEVDHFEVDDEFRNDFNNLFNGNENLGRKGSFEKEDGCVMDKVICPNMIENGDLEGTSNDDKAEVDQDLTSDEKSWDCDDCGEVILGNKAFLEHVIDHAIKEKKALSDANAAASSSGIEKGSKVTNPVAKPNKKKKINRKKSTNIEAAAIITEVVTNPSNKEKEKSKKKALPKKSVKSKKGKTLRESELEVNEAFAEKILVKDDGTFHCKSCPLFVTSVSLLARSHAQSCGIKKKVGRRTRKLRCGDCGEVFMGKRVLLKHIKDSHTMPSYQCSSCLKQFKSRNHYRRHLKIHDQVTAVACPYCSKTFAFPSYKARHVNRVHMKKLKTAQMEQMDMTENEVQIEIIQNEEKHLGNFFWKFEAVFPNIEKSKTSSYQQFYNSLGLYSLEDWNDWMLVSRMLGMSFRADASNDGFELAVVQDPNGTEKVICVGNTVLHTPLTVFSAEYLVRIMVLEMADKAVTLSSFGVVESGTDDDVVHGIEDNIENVLSMPMSVNPPAQITEPEGGMIGETVEMDTVEVVDVEEGSGISNDDKAKATNPMNKAVLSCDHCGASGFRNRWFLKRHIAQMHLGSIKCEICSNVFIDKFHFLQHSKTCFYWCDWSGCNFHEKRKSRVVGHRRSHERET